MRRVRGSAHSSSGGHACAERKIRRPANSRATRATTIKNGRYGSSRVRFPIHAPLKPRVTRTRGPRQHVEASIAVTPPTKSALAPARWGDVLEGSALTCRPHVYVAMLRSKSGNERIACASLCYRCAARHAARAPISEVSQVSAARQKV